MKATETQLVYACLEYLALRKIFAWRANSGGMKLEKRYIRFAGVDGLADIIGVLPDGRFLAIECKMPGKKPTPAQVDFAARITKAGGVSILVHKQEELWVAIAMVTKATPHV